MSKIPRLAFVVGLLLTAIGLAAGAYYFNRLGLYDVPNCEFCAGRPIPSDVRALGFVSSIVFAIGGAITAGVLTTEFRARKRRARDR